MRNKFSMDGGEGESFHLTHSAYRLINRFMYVLAHANVSDVSNMNVFVLVFERSKSVQFDLVQIGVARMSGSYDIKMES